MQMRKKPKNPLPLPPPLPSPPTLNVIYVYIYFPQVLNDLRRWAGKAVVMSADWKVKRGKNHHQNKLGRTRKWVLLEQRCLPSNKEKGR